MFIFSRVFKVQANIINTKRFGILNRTMTPHVSYMKAIDLWVFVCLAFVFASLVEYGLILYLTSRSVWQRKIDQFRKMLYNNRMAERHNDDIMMQKLKSRDKQRSKSGPSETVMIPKGLQEIQCSIMIILL